MAKSKTQTRRLSNGPGKASPAPAETLEQLKQPEPVAELTMNEMRELKARNDTVEKLDVYVQKVREDLQMLERSRMLVIGERMALTRNICESHNLGMDRNSYQIDTEAGVILLVARTASVKAEPIAQAEVEPRLLTPVKPDGVEDSAKVDEE